MNDDIPARVRGTPPTAADIPPPGTYWIKEAQCRYVREATGAYHTWENLVVRWEIAHVDERGAYFVIGTDVDFAWSTLLSRVIEVGPELKPPVEK